MNRTVSDTLPLVLLGAGGHAKVLLALIKSLGLPLLGVCDPGLAQAGEKQWRGVTVLGADEALDKLDPGSVGLVNGIGQLVGNDLRRRVYERMSRRGFSFPALLHPNAWVDDSVEVGDGVQVMAGVVVQPDVYVGANTIINTHASVDHDCRISPHVHIAPGAVLCGSVNLGESVFVGSGARVIQNINIGAHVVVGAGATVVKDVPAMFMVKGASVRFGPISDN